MLSPKIMNFAFDKYANLWGRSAALLSPAFSLPPLVLRLRITNRCNLTCHYCYVGSSLNKKTTDPLTVEEWEKIICTIPPLSLIDITGGEPFLAPHFSEILNIMLDKKLKVSLITNGTIKNEELLSRLVKKKLSHFMISLDGPIAIHDPIRGKGSFEKAISTARFVLEEKRKSGSHYPLVIAKVTLTENSSDSLPDFITYLIEEVGFDGVTINLLFDNDSRNGFADESEVSREKFWTGNKMSFKEESIQPMIEAVEEVFLKYPSLVQLRPDINISEVGKYFRNPSSFSPVGCFKYRSVATIYNDGTITPCDIGINVGNIRLLNYQVPALMQGREMKSFFQFMGNKKSENFPACGGCCLKAHQSTHEA